MNSLLLDIRYAIRMLVKNPLFSFVAIFTLALGIGANSSIFSVVNSVLLRPLPYPEPGQLVQITRKIPPGSQVGIMGEEIVGGYEYLAWKEKSQTCFQIAAYTGDDITLTGLDQAERLLCGNVTSTFFPLLGVQPILGRNFLEEEDRRGGSDVAILSYGFWNNRLGGDPNAIGKTLSIYDRLYTIIGVLPSTFRYSEPFEIYLPLRLDPAREGVGNARLSISLVHALARLKPKIPIEKASRELTAIMRQVQSQYSTPPDDSVKPADSLHNQMGGEGTPNVKPFDSSSLPREKTKNILSMTEIGKDNRQSISAPSSAPSSVGNSEKKTFYVKNTGALFGLEGSEIQLVGLHDHLTGNVRVALLVMLGAVGFVLLIACANIANLFLARTARRRKEIAIRSAMGATRLRVIRMLLVESVLLAVCGGGVGLLFAFWGVDLLEGLGSLQVKYMSNISIDRWVLGFTILLSVITGVVFGFLPALQASKLDLNRVLKENSQESQGNPQRHYLRNSLVIAEIALSLVLLIGAGLLMKSFYFLMSAELGFKTDSLLSAQIVLEKRNYGEDAKKLSFYNQCLQRLQALPGVQYTAIGSSIPLMTNYSQVMMGLQVDGYPRNENDLTPVSILSVSPDYFPALSIPLRQGQYFSERDTTGTPEVAIVNEAFVRQYIPDRNPIGQRVLLPSSEGQNAITIVGVVGNVHQTGGGSDVLSMLYRPFAQNPEPMFSIAIRTTGNPLDRANDLRGIVASIDSRQPVQNIMTLDQRLSDSVAPRRFNMMLLSIFAALALGLACVGIFGLLSYSVIQRTHEIGVRMALGAQKSDIVYLVIGQGMVLTAIGIVLGLSVSFLLTRYLASLLYAVKTTDGFTYICVSVLLVLIALLACYLPAHRAAKVDPLTALRCE